MSIIPSAEPGYSICCRRDLVHRDSLRQVSFKATNGMTRGKDSGNTASAFPFTADNVRHFARNLDPTA